jgi:hypothetical protein
MKMGKTLSIIGLVLGSIGIVTTILLGLVVYRLAMLPLILMIVIGVIAIVFGIIGIIKDIHIGMRIAGVVLGAVSLTMILAVFFLMRYMDYVWPVP